MNGTPWIAQCTTCATVGTVLSIAFLLHLFLGLLSAVSPFLYVYVSLICLCECKTLYFVFFYFESFLFLYPLHFPNFFPNSSLPA